MRHLNKIRKLSRVKKVRVALLNSLARSLVLHERIKTTEPKAKEIKSFVEKLVTKGKKATVASRREINESLGKEATKKMVDTLAKKYESRAGGYTRIIKAGRRASDGSSMAIIEFV
jgi:large subunit ribosomal protein L17